MTHISATTWISGISNYPCTLKPAAQLLIHTFFCMIIPVTWFSLTHFPAKVGCLLSMGPQTYILVINKNLNLKNNFKDVFFTLSASHCLLPETSSSQVDCI